MEFDHVFLAPVLVSAGGMTRHKLRLPDEVAEPLRAAGVRRLVGTVDGAPFRLAMHRSREGFSFLALSRARVAELGLESGAIVAVEVSADPEPDRVDLGAELAAALDGAPDARAVWDGLTPGTRRALAYHVTSAKRTETRRGRATDVVRRLRDGTHQALRRRW